MLVQCRAVGAGDARVLGVPQGCRSWGCQAVGGTLQHPKILTDQLTLFKLGGVDYAHNITTCPNKFSYLPAALQCACCVLMSGQQQ